MFRALSNFNLTGNYTDCTETFTWVFIDEFLNTIKYGPFQYNNFKLGASTPYAVHDCPITSVYLTDSTEYPEAEFSVGVSTHPSSGGQCPKPLDQYTSVLLAEIEYEIEAI